MSAQMNINQKAIEATQENKSYPTGDGSRDKEQPRINEGQCGPAKKRRRA
jgi:hypothetical protein